MRLFQGKKDDLIKNFTQSMIIFQQKDDAAKRWSKPLEIATRALPKGVEDTYEVFNLAYLNSVEGMYNKDLKMIYLWKKFSEKKSITVEVINEFNNSKLKNVFRNDEQSAVLFEGYNRNIRNSIAHATCSYVPENEIMEYRDEQSHWKSSFNSFQLMHLAEKLMIVNFMCDLFYMMLFVYDIAFCPTRTVYPKLTSSVI